MDNRYSAGLLQSGGGVTAVIAQNSLVSFAGALPRQDREDVLDSVLYMRQQANGRFDIRSDFKQWGLYYANGLLDLGWELDLTYAFEPSVPKLYESVLELIGDQVSAVKHSSIRDMAIKTFEALNDDKSILSWFGEQVVVNDLATFQTMPCIHDGNGDVYMFMLGMNMSVTRNLQEFLFPIRSRTGKAIVVEFGATGMSLSRSRYTGNREYVKSMLQARSLASLRSYRLSPA